MSIKKEEVYIYECDYCGTEEETREDALPTGWSTKVYKGHLTSHSCRFCSDVVSLTDDQFIEEVCGFIEFARGRKSMDTLNSCKAELKRRIKRKK